MTFLFFILANLSIHSQIEYDTIQRKHFKKNKVKSRTELNEAKKEINTIYIDTNGLITSYNYPLENNKNEVNIETKAYTYQLKNNKVVYVKTETKHENLLPFQIKEYRYENNKIISCKYSLCNIYGIFSISKVDSIRKITKPKRLPDSGFLLTYTYSKNRLINVKYRKITNWNKTNLCNIRFRKINGIEKYTYDDAGNLINKKSKGEYFGYFDTKQTYSVDTVFIESKNTQKDEIYNCYIIYDKEGKMIKYMYSKDENQCFITKYNYDKNGLINSIESFDCNGTKQLNKTTFTYTFY